MSTVADRVLTTKNPATGVEVGRAAPTPPELVGELVDQARKAQEAWGDAPWSVRRRALDRLRRIVSRDAEEWAALIRDEIGKPAVEAMAGDVVPTLDALRWTFKNAGRALADERLRPSWQRWQMMPAGRLRWRPCGVIGIIGTWNYPLFLNAGPIAQALAAGNAVVWKPSELAVGAGEKLQRNLEEAEFPEGLVRIVQGGGEVGRALVESNIDKAVFTGGVETGRRVLSTLGARGVPAVVELSGFDPAIVLPDAPLDETAKAILWAAMVGCGQTCVATKRVYVVGDPEPWVKALAELIRELKVGDPSEVGTDIGPLISEQARDRFDEFVQAAVEAGARVITGGERLEGPGSFYAPTLLQADSAGPERALEGVFGPVLLVRGVGDADEAISAANSADMALAASVWGRDRRRARLVADRIQAGMVCVNEAVTPAASAVAPFGGFKASGFGRTHGVLGLREFVAPAVTFERGAGGFRPQLFPYGDGALVGKFLKLYRRIFHPRA